MKTKVLWIITALLLSIVTSLQAQTKQKGYTKTKGRLGANGAVIPGTRLANVSVILQGDNSTVSDAKGNFSLSVGTNKFYLKKVQKQGYIVSDPDVLAKQYSCSSNDLVLVLETPSEQLEDKLTAERKIRRTLQQQLQQREDEIEELKEQNKITQEEYQQRLQKLYSDQESDEKLISEMAERYSKMDFDEVDEFNRCISDAILNGRLTEADSLLNTKGDINQRITALRQHQEANTQAEQEIKIKQKNLEKSKALAQKELENLAQDCYSKFEIFKMQHQNDSAAYYIKLRTSLDSTNVEYFFEAGDFIKEYLADYNTSLVLYENALKCACKMDTVSRNAIVAYNLIGTVYADMGQFDLSIQFHEKALNLSINYIGERDLLTAKIYCELGTTYYYLNKFDLADIYFNKDLEITIELLGNEHKDISTTYSNIAQIAYQKGDYETAINYIKNALKIDLFYRGENNPHIATLYNNLGLVYKKIADFTNDDNNYNTALSLYMKALKIRLEYYGEEHPDVAASYNNIGGIYESLKIYEKALEFGLKDLEICERILGTKHLSVATSYNNIGLTYKKMGDTTNALKFYKKALEIRKECLPEESTEIAGSYNNIGSLYYKLKDYETSLLYLEKSYGIFLTLLGTEHSITKIVKQHILEAKEALENKKDAN